MQTRFCERAFVGERNDNDDAERAGEERGAMCGKETHTMRVLDYDDAV